MPLLKQDFAILDKFEFDFQPVGIKYLVKPPDRMEKLDTKMTLCEMLKMGLEGNQFYAGIENHTCDAGLYILGQTELSETFISGEYGSELGVFADRRSASRLYHYIPRIAKGVVNYVAISPVSKLSFDPDVMICLAKTNQAEIILRAMSYKTGQMWASKYSSAIGCAWLFIYPYLNGEINFITTGLGFGMKRRKLFPEGLQFISIPFDVLPSLLQTLKEMPWVPQPYQPDGFEYVKQLRIKLGLDPA
jgi:uncharacterized protein (DUF169 family)